MSYPDTLDSFANPLSSDKINLHTQLHRQQAKAIEAIEKELGLNPAGNYSNLNERLTNLNSNMKQLANQLDDSNSLAALYLSGQAFWNIGYYGCPMVNYSQSTTAQAISTSTLNIAPIVFARDISVDTAAITISATPGVGNEVKVVIYDSNDYLGTPQNLIHQITFDSSVTGDPLTKAVSIDFKADKVYWLGALANGATVSGSQLVVGSGTLSLGFGTDGSTNTAYTALRKTGVSYNAIPTTWDYSSADLVSTSILSVRFKRSK